MNQRATEKHNLYGIVSNQFRQVGERLAKIGQAYISFADALDSAMQGLREGRYVSEEEINLVSQWVDAQEMRCSNKAQQQAKQLCRYPSGTDHLNLNIQKGARAFMKKQTAKK